MLRICNQNKKNSVNTIIKTDKTFKAKQKAYIGKGKILTESQTLIYLALNRMTFLKPNEKILLINLLKDVNEICNLPKDDLVKLLKRKIRVKNYFPQDYVKKAEQDLKYLTKHNIICTFYGRPNYPLLLAEIYDPPLVLFMYGQPDLLREQAIAVVGTRRATGKGLEAAFRLGYELSLAKKAVVSGLALGIDQAAHKGCLKALGKAIAVLGNGIDSIYPRSSRKLVQQLLKNGGLIVSEYPPGIPPLKHHFPARNRIIAGLSEAVVVVEAPLKSGSLITADYALEQGRDLYVHSAGLEGLASAGVINLKEMGAEVISDAGDLLGKKEKTFFELTLSQNLTNYSLAKLLELELDGQIVQNNGVIYRSKKNECQEK